MGLIVPDTSSIQNEILLGLPQKECSDILDRSDPVSWPAGAVLYEPGQTIKFAYFLESGFASMLTIMADGKSVETGICGKEGIIGLPLICDFHSSSTRTVMQVEGSAIRTGSKDLRRTLPKSPGLQKALSQLLQTLAFQGQQIAACNQLHTVIERLSRWLLMAEDRLGANVIPVTQQSLADVLGARRASVTMALSTLQKAELIATKRSGIRIIERSGLKRATCECYEALDRQAKRWKSETRASNPKEIQT
jgi:CRP-like cAMP-binding protein